MSARPEWHSLCSETITRQNRARCCCGFLRAISLLFLTPIKHCYGTQIWIRRQSYARVTTTFFTFVSRTNVWGPFFIKFSSLSLESPFLMLTKPCYRWGNLPSRLWESSASYGFFTFVSRMQVCDHFCKGSKYWKQENWTKTSVFFSRTWFCAFKILESPFLKS